MQQIGTCRLCCQQSELQDSHLLPRAMYKMLRANNVKPDPIFVGDGSTFRTSRQWKHYLLCAKCEDRFNRLGERWVLANTLTSKNEFRIREHLEKSTPVWRSNTCRRYAGALVPEIDMDQLTYFAASVFWRAAVHTWHIPNLGPIGTDLGPFEAGLRAYLLQDAGFPPLMTLLVRVRVLKQTDEIATPPYAIRKHGHGIHQF